MSPAIAAEPLTPEFGAVVRGVDPGRPLSSAEVECVSGLLMRYKVLFFRGRDLSLGGQRDFAAHFGELLVEPLTRNIDGQPGMTEVSKVTHFHSDHMHMADPPKFSMLQFKVLPPCGGDTIWADLVAGYEALSDRMKDFLNGLTALHSSRDPGFDVKAHYSAFLGEELSDDRLAEIRAALVPHAHPVVRWIPETGRANYWVCQRFTRRVVELPPEESDAVLDFLFRHQLQPRFLIRWRWTPGDLAFWDHRTTLHSGVADFGSAPRSGQRASIAGGRPLPVPAAESAARA